MSKWTNLGLLVKELISETVTQLQKVRSGPEHEYRNECLRGGLARLEEALDEIKNGAPSAKYRDLICEAIGLLCMGGLLD